MFVLFNLPNRAFYPKLKHMDEQHLVTTLQNVVAYGILELLSLVALCVVLKRNLHLSPLHHLAFVLENQWRMVQSKLVLWVIYSLQTSIEHFGTACGILSSGGLLTCADDNIILLRVGMDYTFQFLWLRKSAAS